MEPVFFFRQRVVSPHLETIEQEPVIEELVGEEENNESHGDIENLAHDEPIEVDIELVLDVLVEEGDQVVSLLVHIFNVS